MNLYVTGNTIKQLREQKKMTQAELADKIDVSSKTVSKWETAKGLPDISLLEPLSAALGVSVMELMKGDAVINQNRSANLLRSKLYVCPICGNVIHTLGDTVISCCGVYLPALEAEAPDEHHEIQIEPVEDEHFITVHHPMTKSHYISFLAYVTFEKFQILFGLCDIRKVSDDQAVPGRKRRVQISSPWSRIPVLLLQSPRIDDEANPVTRCDKQKAQSECIRKGYTLTFNI